MLICFETFDKYTIETSPHSISVFTDVKGQLRSKYRIPKIRLIPKLDFYLSDIQIVKSVIIWLVPAGDGGRVPVRIVASCGLL